MKRKTPNSTIDEFFATTMKKSAPTFTSSTNSNKNNIVIVKTASQKKILQIEIPSLQQAEKDIDDEYYENRFADITDSLLDGIEILFSGDKDQVNFTKLRNDVEYYCRLKSSKNLFDVFLMPKCSSIIDNFIERLSLPDLDIFQMSDIIESFEESVSNLRKIISYLDRSYIFAHRINGFLSITDIIHNQLRKIFLEQISNENISTLNLIITQVKLQINLFRCSLDRLSEEDIKKKYQISKDYSKVNGRIVKKKNENNGSFKVHVSYQDDEASAEATDDSDVINLGLRSLSIVLKFIDELGLYESNVEDELIKQTQEFYSTISQELSLEQFLEWLSVAQEMESGLLKGGVKVSTINYNLQTINQAALVNNPDIFGQEFEYAVDTRKDQIIKKLYSFFDSTELKPMFAKNLGKHFTSIADNIFQSQTEGSSNTKNISNGGRTIAESELTDKNAFITNPTADAIVRLIDLYSNALHYVSKVFLHDKTVYDDVKKEFDTYFSHNKEMFAILLAKHFSKGLPIENKEIEFFKVIHAKDIFETSYFKLSKDRALDIDHKIDVNREKKLIDLLKKASNQDLVERLQILAKDIEMSQNAEQKAKKEGDKSVDFNAVALYWQNLSNETYHDEVRYPSNIQNNMDLFKEGFIEANKPSFSTPQLHWSSKLSTVVGTIGTTTCQMTGDQALILLALQSQNDITSLDKIHEITGIHPDTILDNLTVMETKEAGFIVNMVDDSHFSINPDSSFNSSSQNSGQIKKKKGKRLIFPSIASVNAQKEKEENESRIEIINRTKIECSIVRKMKVFKLLSLSDLFAKVRQDVDFEPDMIKFSEIVNALVEKEYLQIKDKQIKYVPI